MAILKVQDANNHEFVADTEKIFRVCGDVAEDAATGAGITDSMHKHRVAKVHDVEFYNSKGEVIDAEKLLKDAQSGKTNIVALDVEMEATHSGDNHNYCIYYEDSMEKDCESFVNPFHKPVLKNHNSYSGEPLGRILQAWHGPSKLTDERTAIHLKTRITDQEAIPKFLDGRYGTVSISGTMGTVTCNVCGKNILKDGKFNFCGHWRGETYKDKVCYWGARDIEYHEVSTVNTPADDYAQIMKVTVLTDADEDNNKEEHDMAVVPTNTSADDAIAKAKAAVSDIIDQMLGNVAPSQTQDSATSTDKEAETKAQDGAGTDQAVADSGDGDLAPDAAKDDKIKQLEQELSDAKAELDKTKGELTEAKDNLDKAQKDLEAVQTECDSYKDKCMTLATANKELVVDGIIFKENVAADKVETRKAELMGMSMKELTDMSTKDTEKAAPPRTPAQVNDPTLGVEQKDARANNSGSADVKDSADTKKTRKTVDDFAKEIVGKLSH